MRVNDIEFGRVPRDCLQQSCLRHHRVRPWAAKAERPRPDGMKLGGGLRISAGKQRHLMPQAYQLIDQPRHHPLGAAIELGRNAFGQRRYLGNSHSLSTIEVSGLSNNPNRSDHCPFVFGQQVEPIL